MSRIPFCPVPQRRHPSILITAFTCSVACGGDGAEHETDFDSSEHSLLGRDVTAPTTGTTAEAPPLEPIFSVTEFDLHSLPGAPARLHLDFSGHYQEEPVGDFLGNFGDGRILTPPFDRDGDPLFFSPEEQENIRYIWSYVAEVFAPFNIDVTTVDPDPGKSDPDGPHLRVVFSGEKDFRGDGKGGFAEYGSYADDDDPNIAYIFPRDGREQLFDIRFVALAAVHEAGHAFGLYHVGAPSSTTGRQPIMAEAPFLSPSRTTWTATDQCCPLCPCPQSDMAVIASSDNGFGLRVDEHGNALSDGTPMRAADSGLFASGVIEYMTDVDTFEFRTGGGDVAITLDVARSLGQWCVQASVFTGLCNPVDPPGFGNLDAQLALFRADGSSIAEAAPADSTRANIAAALPAGTYQIQVASEGSYGDVGQYSIKVSERRGPRVVSSRFLGSNGARTELSFTFDEPVHSSTFTVADVHVGGALGVSALSVVAESAEQLVYIVGVRNSSVAARMNVSIGPDITDWFGNRMDQNQNGSAGEASDMYTMSVLPGPGTLGNANATSSSAASASGSLELR